MGALVAAVAYLSAHYGTRIGNFQNDEDQYLELARYIGHHFPGALWQSGIYPRGTQRLDPLLLAAPFTLLRGASAFFVAHIVQSILFASSAIPVFVLARRASLGRIGALFAATLAVVVPWSVVSTSLLSESAAYPAYAWTLLAIWSAARHPRPRNDALLLAALAIAALSRTAMLALAPVAALAVVWHEWGWEMRGRPWARRIRELPGRMWSRHPLLSTAVATAAVALLANELGLLPGRGLGTFTGFYGLPSVPPLSALYADDRYYLSRMVVGTGFLAAAVGLPWTLSALARPSNGKLHALASVCLFGVGATLLSLLEGGSDERYVLYGAAPIALSAAAALVAWARAPRIGLARAFGVVLGTVAVLALIDSTTWPGLVNTYDFFTYPADMFYARVLMGHAHLAHLPIARGLDPTRLIEATILAGAVAFVVVGASRRTARPAAIALGVAVIALSATETVYAVKKYLATSGYGIGQSPNTRSWVDAHLPSKTSAGVLALSMGGTSDYVPIWQTVEFWNSSVQFVAEVPGSGAGEVLLPLGYEVRQLTIQPKTGLFVAWNSTHTSRAPMPSYLLVPRQGTNDVGFESRLVAEDPLLPDNLVRLTQPARADWRITGTSPEGFMAPGRPATITVYDGAPASSGNDRCASFDLIAPPNFSGRWPYRITQGKRTLHSGTLAAQQTVGIVLPLPSGPKAREHEETFVVHVRGQVQFVIGVVSARVAELAIARCPPKPASHGQA